MKVFAGALLLASLSVYLGTFQVSGGGRGVLGFVRAASEAAMVGGLADWFAVTALFRHPLGIPIPHTALIPRRKDAIGRSLQAFVGENFLTEATVRRQLATARFPQRVGGWLLEGDHAERVANEAGQAAAAAVRLLDDADLQALAGQLLRKRVESGRLAPKLARLLEPMVQGGIHHRLVDEFVHAVHDQLVRRGDSIVELIRAQAPHWTPRFVDRSVARRLHGELVRIAAEVDTDPRHPLRRQLDEALQRVVEDLRDDPAMHKRVEEFVGALLARPEFGEVTGDLLAAGRRLLVDQLERPDTDLRQRIVLALRRFGRRLDGDEQLHARVDAAAGRAVAYVLEHFRDELTRVIADTVERWDGTETARKVEVQVGRDLQYIRVNGTVVGAIAGLAIHALTYAL